MEGHNVHEVHDLLVQAPVVLNSHALFVLPSVGEDRRGIAFTLARLAATVDAITLIMPADAVADAPLDPLPRNVTPVTMPGETVPLLEGYREGLRRLRTAGTLPDYVLLCGGHVLGPVAGRLPNPAASREMPALMAPYWHDAGVDERLTATAAELGEDTRLPSLDFTWIGPALLADPGFWALWEKWRPSGDFLRDFAAIGMGLTQLLRAGGKAPVYPMVRAALGSAEPQFSEVELVLAGGGWCLPMGLLSLDPLMHDLHAIQLKTAIDELRRADPEMCEVFTAHAMRNVPLRDFATIADQYEVITDQPADPGKTAWRFGTVGVFIHAFYAEMMPDFWDLIERIPAANHLYITTASKENAEGIRTFLRDKGRGEDTFEVRVVEQNRGRDMSSLFITWRDVVLEDRHEVALRLHSKRTPQVSRQVGQSFKAHLFDNLVHSRGHVANILDRMEAEPDIGLVIPPVIHIGFGTLGHSWWNNRGTVADLARQLDLKVPLDQDTPVTAYGTMYWFRPQAMRKLFAWPWKWDAYNPEPHHVDGGLAHVQERLIGYAVADSGHRVLQVMTPAAAARGYARLEYKLQMMAAFMGSNVVTDQRSELAAWRGTTRGQIYKRLRLVYGDMLRKYPGSRQFLRPFKTMAVRLLMRR